MRATVVPETSTSGVGARAVIGLVAAAVLVVLLSGAAWAQSPFADEVQDGDVPTSTFPGDVGTLVIRADDALLRTERFRGSQRYDTASLIARHDQSRSPRAQSDVAMVARADIFPDSLSGTYLGGQLDAPLLLADRVAGGGGTRVSFDALDDIGADRVVLLGGTAAIPTEVEQEFRDRGFAVDRVGGADRFATARLMAGAGDEIGTFQGRRTAFLASGWDFPDALVSGALSYDQSFPVLLTTPRELHAEARAAIQEHDIDQIIIPGGTAAIPESVEDEVAAEVDEVIRLAGPTRVETSIEIARFAEAEFDFARDHVNFARSDEFPDALALGPHSGLDRSILLLARSRQELNGTSLDEFLADERCDRLYVHIGGGRNAISLAVEDDIRRVTTADDEPCQLTLEPDEARNAVGDDHTVTATVTDNAFTPVSGVEVSFSTETSIEPAQAEPETGTATTDADGEADFTFTSDEPGEVEITAAAERLDGTPITDDAVKRFALDVDDDFDVDKGVDDTSPAVGDTVTFDVTATNTSFHPCTVTELVDTLPEGFAYVDGSATDDLADAAVSVADNDQQTVTFAFDPPRELVVGESLEGTFQAEITEAAPTGVELVNVIDVISPDCDDGRGQSPPITVDVPVDPGEISFDFAKDADTPREGNTARRGDTVTYSVAVENVDEITCDVQSITDVLPEGFAYVEDSRTGDLAGTDASTDDNDRQTVTFAFDPPEQLEPGEALEGTYDVEITDDAPDGDAVNAATVVSELCPDADDDATVVVDDADEDFDVIKEAGEDTVSRGDTLTYSLDVTNTSGMTCDVQAIDDTLPEGFSYIAGSSTGDLDEDQGDVTVTVTDNDRQTVTFGYDPPRELGPGDTLAGTYEVQVAQDAPLGEAINQATVVSQDCDDGDGGTPVEVVDDLAARAARADGYGVRADVGLLDLGLFDLLDLDLLGGGSLADLSVGPEPQAEVTLPPPNAAADESTLVDLQVPEETGGIVDAEAATVTAEADLAAGIATTTSETADVSLLDGLIEADLIQAVSTATCPEAGSLADASDGSRFVNLTVAGVEVPLNPEPNTTIPLPELGEVVVNEVVPDSDHIGFTTRGLRVTLDSTLEGIAEVEIVVAEAHSSIVCNDPDAETTGDLLDAGTANFVDDFVRIDKAVDTEDAEAGDTVTYTLNVSNPGSATAGVFEVSDQLPEGFAFVDGSGGGAFAGVDTEVADHFGHEIVTFDFDGAQQLASGEDLEGTFQATVTGGTPVGERYDDAWTRSDVGTARTGLSTPVNVLADSEPEALAAEAARADGYGARADVGLLDLGALGDALDDGGLIGDLLGPITGTIDGLLGDLLDIDLGGDALVDASVGPEPQAEVTLPPPNAAADDAELVDVKLPEDTGGVLDVEALTVDSEADLVAGEARTTSRTTGVSALGGLVEADVIEAVSTSTCPEAGTLAEASDGSEFVGLTVGGELISVDQPNTKIELRTDDGVGIGEIVINEVVPDSDNIGFTTRGLRITLDSTLAGIAEIEIVVAEAHSSVVCADADAETTGDLLDAGTADFVANFMRIDKEADVEDAGAGDTVAYTLTVSNPGGATGSVFEVSDQLPEGFTFVEGSGGGAFAGVDADVADHFGHELVTFDFASSQSLAPGATLTGTFDAVVGTGTSAGDAYDDAHVHSDLGIGRTGLTAPVAVE